MERNSYNKTYFKVPDAEDLFINLPNEVVTVHNGDGLQKRINTEVDWDIDALIDVENRFLNKHFRGF